MLKKFPVSVAIAATAIMMSACGDSASTDEKKAEGDSTAASTTAGAAGVETKPANTNYKPAFEGQTRIGAVSTKTPYDVKPLTKGLKNPWGIAVLPDGRLLITEKAGALRIATTDGKLSEPITAGIPKVDPQGQGGLLGLTIDPAFATNKMVYWVFSEPSANGNLTAVAKGKLSADEKSIEGAVTIYRATPYYKGQLHYGGRILFDKTGNLIVSTGERSDLATRPQAQDLKSGLGKIVRITTDGKAAPGNPTIGGAERPELYTYGHRNVQSLAFHPQSGDLWEAEFGPRGGDELNRIEAGKNYGWPIITYGIEYAGPKIGDSIQQKDGMEQPVYYWDPVLSPSGMTFYSSDSIPEWKNNLFISGLSSQHIVRLVIENNKVVGEERLLSGENKRFRAVMEGKDGALYAVTDEGDATLYRISKK
ncbi:MAG: PQQ-dependent sugar dehydrogenase [Flavitalea sp.]